MALRIHRYGEAILREKGKTVTTFDDGLRQLSGDMIEAMYANNGMGVTAHQVGEAIQLFVIDPGVKTTEADFFYELDGERPLLEAIMPLVVVNPAVIDLSAVFTGLEEGCLSFPGVRGRVKRCHEIRMHYQDIDGNEHILFATGSLAGLIQHLCDHLDGKLFIDIMDEGDLLKNRQRLNDIEQGLL